jgi:hypothetical protein
VNWLERAGGFAMTAIAQCAEARKDFGRGRYSLWTGDLGLAIYLWNARRASRAFRPSTFSSVGSALALRHVYDDTTENRALMRM